VRFDRRSMFFLFAAGVCLALVAPTPAEFRWVNYATAGLALFWGVLIGIESLLNNRRRSREPERAPGVVPTRASARSPR